MVEHLTGLASDTERNLLFQKIKAIANDAPRIQRAIETDLMDFAESKGKDMSTVRAAIEDNDRRK